MNRFLRLLPKLIGCAALLACSSAPKPAQNAALEEPLWTHSGTRFVEGSRVVYIGSATAVNKETALSKAEGGALEDIANECSLIPKSTRLDSRYSVRGTYEYDVRIKMSVDLAECELSRQAVEPGLIRYYANAPLTVQLLQYQDRNEDLKPLVSEVEPPVEMPGIPERDSHWDDTQHYYVVRQALVYMKMFPVLSPSGAYAPFTSQSKHFTAAVQPVVQRLNSMQINNPALKEKLLAWSDLQDRPRVGRPEALVKREAAPIKRGGPVKPPPSAFPKRKTGG